MLLTVSTTLQSTVVNILNIYSFRHGLTVSPKGSKNSFCYFLMKCATELNLVSSSSMSKMKTHMRKLKKKLKDVDSVGRTRRADISLQHQLCDMDGQVTQNALSCAFRSHNPALSQAPIKQITLVREPLSRAISVYYFWGELFKLKFLRSQAARGGKVVNAFQSQ